MDTEAKGRETASKRGPAELDDTQMDEQLEQRAENYGLDITLLDRETRVQAFRAVSQMGNRTSINPARMRWCHLALPESTECLQDLRRHRSRQSGC